MDDLSSVELIKQIKEAFKKVPFPGRKIGEKEELTDFLGKTWKEISIEAININITFLFFNNDGLRYYLQAYLIAVLAHPEKVNSSVPEAVLRELGYERIWEGICEIFNKKQQLAILAFFEAYESLFPVVIREDFTKGQVRLAKMRQDQTRKQIEQAVLYWKSCTQGKSH